MKSVYRYILSGVFISFLMITGCSEPPLPKPKAMLRLEYPAPRYEKIRLNCPFHFEKNTRSEIRDERGCSFVMHYPGMKANVFVTYKPVDENLDILLRDAQKLTYEHVVKADNISEQPFVNADDKVYGMFYNIEGNAASQTQFYLTDSTRHFVTGSVYFEAKPNYDSILPAAGYLSNDIRKVMETFKWE